ncbi:MAG: ribulose-phosphate 3-epimerase [Bacilli bacterium]|jgi:ribulose-phosphate 3-epimerase
MVKISVSILSKNNNETILKLNDTNCDYLHIDVMDGKFVSETQFSCSRIEEISLAAKPKLDVHLMVEQPSAYIDNLPLAKVEYITIHYETLNGDISIINYIKNKGIKCGLSIKPNTDIRVLFPLLKFIDLVLIMSVEPGRGGQTFMSDTLNKVRLLKTEIIKEQVSTIISIDGGINNDNAKLCVDAGCDMLVSGSYITNSEDYQIAVDNLR